MATIICDHQKFLGIEAILFDKDGTLEDSRLYLRQLAQERVKQIPFSNPQSADDLLMAFGVSKTKIDPKGLMAVGSRAENELAAAAYLTKDGYSQKEAQTIVHQAFNKAAQKIKPNCQSSPLFPNSLLTIKSLAKAHIKLGIVSADSTQGIKNFLKREHIDSYFSVTLGSNNELHKPDPLMYLKACNLLKVQPQNTLMIGDSIGDIQMAKQANARGTIGIIWHDSSANHLKEATIVVNNLATIKTA